MRPVACPAGARGAGHRCADVEPQGTMGRVVHEELGGSGLARWCLNLRHF